MVNHSVSPIGFCSTTNSTHTKLHWSNTLCLVHLGQVVSAKSKHQRKTHGKKGIPANVGKNILNQHLFQELAHTVYQKMVTLYVLPTTFLVEVYIRIEGIPILSIILFQTPRYNGSMKKVLCIEISWHPT